MFIEQFLVKGDLLIGDYSWLTVDYKIKKKFLFYSFLLVGTQKLLLFKVSFLLSKSEI